MWTEPQTDEDWQMAVDMAEGCLVLEAARQYGLVAGGPHVNVDRCHELIDRGRARGTYPSPNAAELYVRAYNAALEASRPNACGRR